MGGVAGDSLLAPNSPPAEAGSSSSLPKRHQPDRQRGAVSLSRTTGTRTGTGYAPLDYRLRFPALKMTTSAAATSTAMTTFFSRTRFRRPTGST